MSGHLRLWSAAHRRDDRAAQIVEFAVALPLLVVFVVGIFDFSGAFTSSRSSQMLRGMRPAPPPRILSAIFSAALPVSVNDAFQTLTTILWQTRSMTAVSPRAHRLQA